MSRRWLSLALLLAACGHKDPAPRTTVAPDADAAEIVDAAPPVSDAEPGLIPWPDAVRLGRWEEAARGLALLDSNARALPEVRLASAKVALASRHPADAITALEKLEDELPLVRELVARMRAQAMFEVGPFDKAAAFYETRKDVGSLVQAAEAWEKVGDATKARSAWDRVVGAEKRSRAQEERARSRRLAITRLKDGDPAAGVDARWLTINALDATTFGEAAELLEKLEPPRLLTGDELLARARVLADAGRSEEALRAVERATTRANYPALDVCRAKAEVLWKAKTRYPEAAIAYRSCSQMGGAHAAEDLFLAARSFIRSERDPDAVPVLKSVMEKFPRTTWAEQAEFHIARIDALNGRWSDAAHNFDEYAKHWSNGKERREAERYRALAHLLVGNNKTARKLLEPMSGGAEDAVTGARWANLAALAALRDGDRTVAMARWAEVVRSRPLTYPALVARARIKANGGTPPASIEPAVAGDAEPLSINLPAPADLLHRIGLDAEAEEAIKEREPAIVAQAPTRGTEALCAAYARVERAKRRYAIASQVPQNLLATAPGGKNRSAWECSFPEPYPTTVEDAAREAHVGAELVWSVMRQESAFDPEVVSPARAVGLMQLLPETGKATATKNGLAFEVAHLTSPAENIRLGALYLHELFGQLGEKPALVIASYNAGPEAILRWRNHAKLESLDVYVEAIPYVETRGYVARVLGNLARYGYLMRGEAGVPDLDLKEPASPAKTE